MHIVPASLRFFLLVLLTALVNSRASAAPVLGVKVTPLCASDLRVWSWRFTNSSASSRSIRYLYTTKRRNFKLVRLAPKQAVEVVTKRNPKIDRTTLELEVSNGRGWNRTLIKGKSYSRCLQSGPAVAPTATPTAIPTLSAVPTPTVHLSTPPTPTTTLPPSPTIVPTTPGPSFRRNSPILVSLSTIDRSIFEVGNENGKNLYRLQRSVEFSRSGLIIVEPNAIIDLNGFTLSFNVEDVPGSAGIYAYRYASPEKWGIDAKTYPEVVNFSRANGINPTIRNGEVFWRGSKDSASKGNYATGILATADVGTITIENVKITAGSSDGWCVYANYSALTIRDSWCNNQSEITENRHQLPGSIRASNKVLAERNVVIGGNSAFIVGPDSVVQQNIINQSGFATNGYGIHTYKVSNTKFLRNIIVPKNGRGIMYNGGIDSQGSIQSSNNEAFDNLIVARESSNAEFGDNLNAPCFRMRYDTDGNSIHDNYCFAFGGAPYTAASGIYLTNYPGSSPTAPRINYFYNNLLAAFLVGDPGQAPNPFRVYANGLTFEGQGKSGNLSQDTFNNNLVVTNSYGIRVSGADGAGYQGFVDNTNITQSDGAFIKQLLETSFLDPRFNFSYPARNSYVTASSTATLRRSLLNDVVSLTSGKPASWSSRPFAPIHTGYYSSSELWLAGTQLPSGEDIREQDIFVENPREGPSRIVVAHQMHVLVLQLGVPMANTSLQVLYGGTVVKEVFTDSQGRAVLPVVDAEFLRSINERSFRKITATSSSLRKKGTSGAVELPSQIRNTQANAVRIGLPL